MITPPFVGTKLIPVLRTYTQLHQTWRHNTTNIECLKEIMLETTWNHIEGRNERLCEPHAACRPYVMQVWYSCWFVERKWKLLAFGKRLFQDLTLRILPQLRLQILRKLQFYHFNQQLWKQLHEIWLWHLKQWSTYNKPIVIYKIFENIIFWKVALIIIYNLYADN